MKHVEEYLGMNRRSLIALGLLLGCDYDEHGISGIGKVCLLVSSKLLNNF